MQSKAISRSNALGVALRSFIEKQKSLSPLNNFEALMAGYTERLQFADDANPSTKVARELFELCRDYFFLQRVGELKLSYIASLEAAIQTENLTVEFSLLRSLVEHASAFCFQVETISGLASALVGQNSEQRIQESIKTCHYRIQRLYYGSGAPDSHFKRFNVNDLLRSMVNRLPDIKQTYEDLCEFVHPKQSASLDGQIRRWLSRSARSNPYRAFR